MSIMDYDRSMYVLPRKTLRRLGFFCAARPFNASHGGLKKRSSVGDQDTLFVAASTPAAAAQAISNSMPSRRKPLHCCHECGPVAPLKPPGSFDRQYGLCPVAES